MINHTKKDIRSWSIGKPELVKYASEISGVDKISTAKVYTALIFKILEFLEADVPIFIPGLGKFSVRRIPPSKNYDIASHSWSAHPGYRRVKFKSSVRIKCLLNPHLPRLKKIIEEQQQKRKEKIDV